MSTPPSAGGRIRPLARRLDSLAGSPTGGSRAPPTVLRPRISSSNVHKGQQEEKSDLKHKEDPDISVKDMLAQARRREAASLSKQETGGAHGRKQQQHIITDVSSNQMECSFLADTTKDIDLEGNEGVSITSAKNDDRCFPIRMPFSQNIPTSSATPDDTITLSNDELMLIQLPSLFPTLVSGENMRDTVEKPSSTSGGNKRGQKQTSSAPKQISAKQVIGTPFSEIPDGQIGTIKIHKSGKHVLHVGKTRFVIKEGQNVNFRTEVACVCPGEDEIIFLGQSEKRLVVTPVIYSL